MRLTVRNRFHFGDERELVGDDLVRPEVWDALRTRSVGAFAMAHTRVELDEQADARPEIGERTRLIDKWLGQRDVRTLASYGVGGAVVELWLHRHDAGRHLIGTDYAEATLERLRKIFPELETVARERPLAADIHLFHRSDTKFSNREFHALLRRFANVPVLVVATGVHSLEGLVGEMRKRLVPGSSRAGGHATALRSTRFGGRRTTRRRCGSMIWTLGRWSRAVAPRMRKHAAPIVLGL